MNQDKESSQADHLALIDKSFSSGPYDQNPIAFRNRVHILVAEHEEALCDLLCASLQASGFLVTAASDGNEARALLQEHAFDLIVLDVMLPELDGFTLCAELRVDKNVPIVMLSALNRSDDIIYGFCAGADAYICKPFNFRELDARLLAILRRTTGLPLGIEPTNNPLNGMILSDKVHKVKVGNKLIDLTRIEYQLLRYLMNVPNCAVSKRELLQKVWEYEPTGSLNCVEVAIRRLRLKIETDPSEPVYLVTVRGFGYKFNTHAPLATRT